MLRPIKCPTLFTSRVLSRTSSGVRAISRDLSSLGRRLAEERKRIGLGAARLGEIGGVNRDSQGAYEAGKRSCTAAYLLAVGEAGIDPAYVLTGRRDAEQIEEDEASFLDCFRLLDDEDRAALMRIASSMAGKPSRNRRVHTPALEYKPS